MRRTLTLILLLSSGIGCSPFVADAPDLPAALISTVARATITLSAISRAPENAPPIVVAATNLDADHWRVRFTAAQAPALARELEGLLGAPVLASDLDLSGAADQWTLRVKGDSPQSALARCSTLVRILAKPLETERGAARAWLDAERARTLGSLRDLERSLQVLPPEAGGRELPRSWDEALTEAQVHVLEARAETAMLPSLPQPAALRRLEINAMAEAAPLAVELGAAHPARQRAAALVEALHARIEAQLGIERRVAEEWRSKIEARARDRRGDVRRALREILRDRLGSRDLGPGAVASSDPLSLRRIAIERAAEEAEIAALGARYGARHPQRLLAAERLAQLDASFEIERKSLLSAIDQELQVQDAIGRVAGRSVAVAAGPRAVDPGGSDRRAQALSDERLALAATLERLARWDDALGAASPAPIVSTCALAR
ncbi:MAG: hypothetical protein ABJE95_00435 [Byssovorax sp.]